MIERLKRFFGIKPSDSPLRGSQRYRRAMSKCGCVCWCPYCKDILNDQAEATEQPNGLIKYRCGCGECSEWDFSAPVPILMKPHIEASKHISSLSA